MKMLILLIATAIAAAAQDTPDFSQAIPARPQAPIRWAAEFSYPSAAGETTRRPMRITVDYTKPATRVVESMANGPSIERWYAHGLEVCRVPEVAEPIVIPPDNPPDLQTADYSRVFFPLFSWVGQKSFRGKEKKFGQDVFVFESPFGTASTQRAYISAANLLPLALESPSFTIRYSFAAAEPVELPADFREVVEKYRSQLRAALKPVGSN